MAGLWVVVTVLAVLGMVKGMQDREVSHFQKNQK